MLEFESRGDESWARGGRGSKTEKATQNIHWRKMCPRPPVWSELGTGQAAGQWWLSMFTPGMCFKHQSNNHNYNTNSITTICPDKHGQVRPWVPRDDGDITGQARLCVSVCSEMGDKCLALGDIMWHQSPGDQGAGQLGSPADCLGWSELMCHDDTRLLIITHLNVLLRWIQFAGPLHSRNMPLISNPGDWFTVDTVLTHEQIHFQYLFWFLGLLQLLLTQMMRFRCHDSKLWDDYCYYN